MPFDLSTGALQLIPPNNELSTDPIIVQIIDVKRLRPSENSTPIIKMTVSDGNVSFPCSVVSQLSDKFLPKRMSIIKLKLYVCNNFSACGKALVVLDFDELIDTNSPETVQNANVNDQTTNVIEHEEEPLLCAVPTEVTPVRNATQNPVQTRNSSRAARNLFNNNSLQIGQAQIRSPVRPIDSLNSSLTNYRVRVLVTFKSHVISYNSDNYGPGKLFKMYLSDNLGEICAIAFNEFCDQFFNSFELYKVYYISNAKVSDNVKREFTSVKNSFQLEFNERTTVEVCNDGTGSEIPSHRFSFSALNIIPELPIVPLIDVIGIVRETFELKCGTKTYDNGTVNEWKKRSIRLIDSSNTSIILNLWGKYADECPNMSNGVLAIKGVRIELYAEKYQLTTVKDTSVLNFEPTIPVAESLRMWYAELDRVDGNGCPIDNSQWLSSQSIDYGMSDHVAPLTTIEILLQESHIEGSLKQNFTISGTIIRRKRIGDLIYKACLQHNKKFINNADGNLVCPNCGLNAYSWRIYLSVLIDDGTGELWVTLFNETSEQLLNWCGSGRTTAESLAILKEENEDEYNGELDKILNNSFVFKVHSSPQFYNGKYRLQTQCKRLDRIEPLEQQALDEIQI